MAKENLAMLIPPDTHTSLVHHTFGRDHCDPPPLPASVQLGQVQGDVPADSQGMAMPEVHLPQDFDHLVRSIGEW